MTFNANSIRSYLTFGLALAADARRTLAGYGQGFKTELKSDKSYVTEVDVAIERALRAAIAARFPDHGVLGEELAPTNPEAEYQWILDPIDGTDNFAHGIPTFGTIVGLHYRGTPIVGVIDHPALGLIFSAARGLGAFCNSQRVTVNDYAQISGGHEMIAIAAADNFAKSGSVAVLERVQRQFPNTRTYRDCFAHTRAVCGSVAAAVDVNLNRWDLAATQVLVEEAGGKYVCVGERDLNDKRYYSVVFGRRETVDALVPLLNDL